MIGSFKIFTSSDHWIFPKIENIKIDFSEWSENCKICEVHLRWEINFSFHIPSHMSLSCSLYGSAQFSPDLFPSIGRQEIYQIEETTLLLSSVYFTIAKPCSLEISMNTRKLLPRIDFRLLHAKLWCFQLET